MATINGTYMRVDAEGDAHPLNGVTVEAWLASDAFLAALATYPNTPELGTPVPTYTAPSGEYYTTITDQTAGGIGAWRIEDVTAGEYWVSFTYEDDIVVWEYQLAGIPIPSITSGIFFNVMDYGAVADGATDNTTAFASTITAAFTSAAGGTVYVPRGVYAFASALVLPATAGDCRHLAIVGEGASFPPSGGIDYGQGSVLLFSSVDVANGFTYDNALGADSPTFRFENLTIVGPSATSESSYPGSAFTFRYNAGTPATPQIIMNNIRIQNFHTVSSSTIESDGCGLLLNNVKNSSFTNVMVRDCTYGIYMDNASNNNAIINCSVETTLQCGIHMTGNSNYNTFISPMVKDNEKHGLHLNGASTNFFLGAYLNNNNSTTDANSWAIHLEATADTWYNLNNFFLGTSLITSHDKIMLNGDVEATYRNGWNYFVGGKFENPSGAAMATISTYGYSNKFDGIVSILYLTDSGTFTKIISQDGNLYNTTFWEAGNLTFGTTTGSKIGTSTAQKIGFWNATPVVQQVLATGTGKSVDNVITFLQTIGLCKQS